MTTPTSFDDLDLNNASAREQYFERCRAEFEGMSDEEVIAQAKSVVPYCRADWRWGAVRDIAEHRIKIARQVEPKMEKFRKVREGWYTIAIVSFDEVMQDIKNRVPDHLRRYEEHVDLSRCGDEWIVSTRGGKDHQDTIVRLNQHSLFAQRVRSFADGRRYAVALRAYLMDKGPNPDWLLSVFSKEHEAAHRADIERKVGMPYDEWEAKLFGRTAG